MSTPPRTVGDFLKVAGVAITPAPATEPAKAAEAPAKTEPAKAAAKAGKTIPATTPVGGHKPATNAETPTKQDTGAGADTAASTAPAKEAEFDALGIRKLAEGKIELNPQVYKTAEQNWLAHRGVFITDAATAKTVYDQNVKVAEANKQAELEKNAEEERLRGVLQFQGQCSESAAMQLAMGEATVHDAMKVAALTGIPFQRILDRAAELKGKLAALESAVPSPALVDGLLGSAARTNSSQVMEAAERNGATTEATNDAVAQTRGPVSGQDEKLVRFDSVVTLPGNPGLNNGQRVDQGKALGQ